jgi:hypothetical protein
VKVTKNPYEKCSRSCYDYHTVDVTAAKVTVAAYDIQSRKFDEATMPAP